MTNNAQDTPSVAQPLVNRGGFITQAWLRWLQGGRVPGGLTIPLIPADGGTGQTSFADGQLLIGDGITGGLDKNTLIAGPNISITNSPGNIKIAATGISSGTVTSVKAGYGLGGGTITTSGTINSFTVSLLGNI